MSRSGIQAWYLVHKWTSLVCTLFLLMLCITGLPLIFHDELERLLGQQAPLAETRAGVEPPTLDAITAKVLASRPGEVVLNLSFDPDRPVVNVITGKTLASIGDGAFVQPVNLRTGDLVPPPQEQGFLYVMKELHVHLFADQPGTYFLGAMGAVFLMSMVSGVVLYAPFMRKLAFGTVRLGRSARLRWLDLHNLLGIAVAAWLIVVGFTGVFNTLDRPLANQFRTGQLAEMTAPYRNAPALSHLGSIDAAIATARRASPGMEPVTIAYPGTFFGTPHHYNVFMRGISPVSRRLLKPTLVDAATGELTDTRDMPLHIRALFLSRPLHFGDYGGLFLKIVWAVLDIIAIIVLVSGLILWLGRRGTSLDRRVAEVERGGAGGKGIGL